MVKANAMVLSSTGWRTIFYLGIAFDTCGTVLAFFFYHPKDPLATEGMTTREILKGFDWVGLVGIASGPTMLIVAISSLNVDKFTSPKVLGTFIPGIVIIIATGFWGK